MTLPSSSDSTITCPACGTPGAGHFCANCGASLQGATCAACRAPLSAGAKFCHRCGTPAGAGVSDRGPTGPNHPATGQTTALPWAVAAIALLALIALVAGQRFNRPAGSTLDAPSNALPQASLGEVAIDPGAGGPLVDQGPARAPDISSLSPDERAARLFDRVMRYDEQGKRDSLEFFAPMALQSFQSIPNPTTDQRYDLGRIGEVTGDYAIAKAQADTILRANPTHLLALALAARMSPDPTQRAEFERRLLAAEPSERAKPLPEYQGHRADIDRAVAEAKKNRGVVK